MERGYLSHCPYTEICGSSDAAKSKCFTKILVAHLHLLINYGWLKVTESYPTEFVSHVSYSLLSIGTA